MFVADKIRDYRILDTGDGMKLESWAGILLARPDPQVLWPKSKPQLWQKADAVYRRSNRGGGSWEFLKKLPERWQISYGDLRFYVRPTGFKHTGLFPEQSANWQFMMDVLEAANRPAQILNLFAYTGGASLACASKGAKVTHVDAAKSMNQWAKENAQLSGLGEAPIRYIADDCLKFVERELRRGRQYDGIIMDPPSYGRGANGQVWKVEENLFHLVEQAVKLLSDRPLFFLVNSYTTGLSSVVTANMLHLCLEKKRGGRIQAGDLALPVEQSGVFLPCGTTARWQP